MSLGYLRYLLKRRNLHVEVAEKIQLRSQYEVIHKANIQKHKDVEEQGTMEIKLKYNIHANKQAEMAHASVAQMPVNHVEMITEKSRPKSHATKPMPHHQRMVSDDTTRDGTSQNTGHQTASRYYNHASVVPKISISQNQNAENYGNDDMDGAYEMDEEMEEVMQ